MTNKGSSSCNKVVQMLPFNSIGKLLRIEAAGNKTFKENSYSEELLSHKNLFALVIFQNTKIKVDFCSKYCFVIWDIFF